MAIPAIWALSGYIMALFLAGFRGVPEELREAARMDGASEWRVYRHVVFPYLRPVTLAALIILGHISIKVFDLIVAIGGKQIDHRGARRLHVGADLRRARLRQGSGDRDAAARRGSRSSSSRTSIFTVRQERRVMSTAHGCASGGRTDPGTPGAAAAIVPRARRSSTRPARVLRPSSS